MDPATMMLGAGALLGGVGGFQQAFGSNRTADPTESAAYWQNRHDQYEFAENAVQWRVKDAIAAGLHPLYALGGNVSTYSPQAFSIGGDGDAERRGLGLERMGQNLQRAAAATETAEQREMKKLNMMVLESQISRNHAEAIKFMSDARRMSSPQIGPPLDVGEPLTVPGQGDSGVPSLFGDFIGKPREVTSRQWDAPHRSALSGPLWDLAETRPGVYTPFFYGGQPSEQFENPLAALWAISEAMAADPNWLRNSGFPYGVALNEFIDWRDRYTHRALDTFENRFSSSRELQAEADRLRRRHWMIGRGRNRAPSERFGGF